MKYLSTIIIPICLVIIISTQIYNYYQNMDISFPLIAMIFFLMPTVLANTKYKNSKRINNFNIFMLITGFVIIILSLFK